MTVTDDIMLPSNTSSASSAAAADSIAVNGSAVSAVMNGALAEVNGTNEELDGNAEACYTPVTDPDSVALLAAMHEANRFAPCLSHTNSILLIFCLFNINLYANYTLQ